jgi:hypothetical protein
VFHFLLKSNRIGFSYSPMFLYRKAFGGQSNLERDYGTFSELSIHSKLVFYRSIKIGKFLRCFYSHFIEG